MSGGPGPAWSVPRYVDQIASARVAILVDSTCAGGLHVTVEINDGRVELDCGLEELERILQELLLAL
jgi:hypothetical protein